MEYQVKDGVLNLRETKAVSGYTHIDIDFMGEVLSGGNESGSGVVLYLPEKKVLKNIDVTMDFGDVQMNGVQAEGGNIRNDDGDIVLSGCKMQDVKIEADYGDVELKSGTWQNGSITLDDGDVSIKSTKLSGNISISNSYGDIDLELAKKDLEQLEITAKTDFGDIDVPDEMEELVHGETDEYSFSYTPDQAVGRLDLVNDDGDISIEND